MYVAEDALSCFALLMPVPGLTLSAAATVPSGEESTALLKVEAVSNFSIDETFRKRKTRSLPLQVETAGFWVASVWEDEEESLTLPELTETNLDAGKTA